MVFKLSDNELLEKDQWNMSIMNDNGSDIEFILRLVYQTQSIVSAHRKVTQILIIE